MDRISGLPDDVTGHILSFLPTIKSLVETSTLSKAWRFRWTHATKIAYFRETPNSNTQKPYIISSTNFHISSPGTTTDSEFESWMIATALRNVRTLFIYLHHHLKLPPCLFASEMLVDLSLVDCGSISTSFAINFPALRKLHLKNVVCENEQSLPHLLSRCPVLEELIVERMIFSVIEARWRAFFDVSSPTLTRVVLDLDKVYLTLDTPALRYIRLRLRQSMVSEDWATLDSLIEADIDLNEDKFERGRFTGESCYAFIVKKIVGRFCNAKCLTLSTQRIPWPQPFALDVKFNNLTELKLSADCQIVTSFLVNANNLRLLTICRMVDHKPQHNRIRPNSLANCWRSHIDKAACLKSHLERVSVVDFEWARKQEFDMVSYILRYARVLKTMEIIYTPQYELDSDQKLEAHNKLASFERGSNICELVFV